MNFFDAAIEATEAEFRSYAIDWLNRRIGFDGVIWGGGSRAADGGFAINSYFLQGRPQALIAEYPQSAASDPVSLTFIDSPHKLQNISTHAFYRTPALADMRDYLEQYKVRQLQLMGGVCPVTGAYDWLVFYREDITRAFSKEDEAMTKVCVSMALQGAKLQATAAACHSFAHKFDAGRQHTTDPVWSALTVRQHQVLFLLAKGWPNKLIAAELAISENTLKTHLATLYRVLGVSSRVQAVIRHNAYQGQLNGNTPQQACNRA